MIPVAIQPMILSGRGNVQTPMVCVSHDSSIMPIMIGTAAKPLMTAAQNSMRIGSIPIRVIATPPKVAAAMTP